MVLSMKNLVILAGRWTGGAISSFDQSWIRHKTDIPQPAKLLHQWRRKIARALISQNSNQFEPQDAVDTVRIETACDRGPIPSIYT